MQWSRKSRPLHAKGAEQVLKWLQEIKGHYSCIQDEAGLRHIMHTQRVQTSIYMSIFLCTVIIFFSPAMQKTSMSMPKIGALLLSSCWKHYSNLLHLEDHKFSQHCKELLDQYISGIQVKLVICMIVSRFIFSYL